MERAVVAVVATLASYRFDQMMWMGFAAAWCTEAVGDVRAQRGNAAVDAPGVADSSSGHGASNLLIRSSMANVRAVRGEARRVGWRWGGGAGGHP